MEKSKRKKKIKQPPLPNAARSERSREEAYRIFKTDLRAKTRGRRILPDLTADLTQYEDVRKPHLPGKTIRNEFKKYPWKPTPFNTAKK